MKVLTTYTYKGWVAKLIDDHTLVVQCKGEVREYTLEPIIKSEQKGQYIYFEMAGGMYYSFKFEDGDFLVGDFWDSDDEHIDVAACHVFGELDLSLN